MHVSDKYENNYSQYSLFFKVKLIVRGNSLLELMSEIAAVVPVISKEA